MVKNLFLTFIMKPKEINDVKKFLSLATGDQKQGKDGKEVKETKRIVYVKTSKKITKFKLRGKKYLYTLKTADQGKAQKLLTSLPANVVQVKIGAKKVAAKKKKK